MITAAEQRSRGRGRRPFFVTPARLVASLPYPKFDRDLFGRAA